MMLDDVKTLHRNVSHITVVYHVELLSSWVKTVPKVVDESQPQPKGW
jgi:hypothetical protein